MLFALESRWWFNGLPLNNKWVHYTSPTPPSYSVQGQALGRIQYRSRFSGLVVATGIERLLSFGPYFIEALPVLAHKPLQTDSAMAFNRFYIFAELFIRLWLQLWNGMRAPTKLRHHRPHIIAFTVCWRWINANGLGESPGIWQWDKAVITTTFPTDNDHERTKHSGLDQ